MTYLMKTNAPQKSNRAGFCQLRRKSESEQQSQSHSAAIKEEYIYASECWRGRGCKGAELQPLSSAELNQVAWKKSTSATSQPVR